MSAEVIHGTRELVPKRRSAALPGTPERGGMLTAVLFSFFCPAPSSRLFFG